MNTDAQRIAIAEACGWNHVHYARDLSESCGKETFRGQPPGRRDYYDNVPDYLNDLNAMHEAEKTLKGHDVPAYFGRLATDTHDPKLNWNESCAWQAHSTAAQRAEAFLRTIGKWEESS